MRRLEKKKERKRVGDILTLEENRVKKGERERRRRKEQRKKGKN